MNSSFFRPPGSNRPQLLFANIDRPSPVPTHRVHSANLTTPTPPSPSTPLLQNADNGAASNELIEILDQHCSEHRMRLDLEHAQRQLSSLSEDNEMKSARFSQLEAEISALKSAVQTKERFVREANEAVQQYKKLCDTSMSKANNFEKRFKEAEEKLVQALKANQELSASTHRFQEELANSTSVSNLLKKQLQSSEEERVELSKRADAALSAASESKRVSEQAVQRLKSEEQRSAELIQKLTQIEGVQSEQGNFDPIPAYEEKLEIQIRQLASAMQSVNSLTEHIYYLQNKSKEDKKIITDMRVEIRAKADLASEFQTQLQETRKQLIAAQDEVCSTKADLDKVRVEARNLQASEFSHRNKVQDLQFKLEQMKKLSDQIQSDTRQSHLAEMTVAQETIQFLRDEIAELRITPEMSKVIVPYQPADNMVMESGFDNLNHPRDQDPRPFPPPRFRVVDDSADFRQNLYSLIQKNNTLNTELRMYRDRLREATNRISFLEQMNENGRLELELLRRERAKATPVITQPEAKKRSHKRKVPPPNNDPANPEEEGPPKKQMRPIIVPIKMEPIGSHSSRMARKLRSEGKSEMIVLL